jgi:threonine dehydrogenase-like Zn-dependent dehydrogenase
MPSLPYDQLLLKQIRLVGALSASHWAVHQAIRMVESGRFPVQLMHTHSLPLEKAARAIHLLAGEVEGESALHISLVRDRFL